MKSEPVRGGGLGVLVVVRSLRERAELVIPTVLIAAFTASAAQTIVISALPAFGSQLGVSPGAATWILTGFMLTSAVATPVAGRLGDLFGYRPVLLTCLACLTVGTLAAAIGAQAGMLPVLLAGRVLQGVSGGVFPVAFGIVRTHVPAARAARVIALLSAMFGIGGAGGLVAAGPLVGGMGTPGLFWPTLGLALVALALTSTLPAAPSAERGRVDVVGVVLLSGALVCLPLGISMGGAWGWSSAGVIVLFAGSLGLLAAFAVAQLRVPEPLVDLRLLLGRSLATTNMVTLVIGVALFGGFTIIPAFVQTPSTTGFGFGVSVTGAGLVLVPMVAAMLLASPLAPRLGARFGSRAPLQLGALGAAAAFALIATEHSDLWMFYAAGVLVGAGYGLSFAAIGVLVFQAVDASSTGVATGLNTVVRTVGGAVGAQIAAAILDAGPTSLPTESGYTAAFAVFTVVALAAVALTCALPAHRPQSSLINSVR